MTIKPTYQELEDQITELKKENQFFRLQNLFQKEEDREGYYRTTLNNVGDPIFVKDDQSKLLIVNDAFCEVFGLTRAKIIGKTLAEDVSPEEKEVFLKIDNQVLLNGKESIDEESLTIRGDETRIISTRKTRFINSDGKKFLVGIMRDITKRTKYEIELKESEAQLKELNVTKDKLFSIIAHDLRSPFNNILGISALLIEKANESGFRKYKNHLNIINSTAYNTLILLDNLLNWAQSQVGNISFNPKKIILSDAILQIIKHESSIAMAKNISLDYVSSVQIEVYADENMLSTVLRNLISNAIKFTKSGGEINFSAMSKQDHVEITISDNGIGMNAEKCKELFNMPTSTSGTANEKGSGLGLMICKEFVEKHKGKIWVESKDGKGSDFKFTLPTASRSSS